MTFYNFVTKLSQIFIIILSKLKCPRFALSKDNLNGKIYKRIFICTTYL